MELSERIKQGWEVSAEGYTMVTSEDFEEKNMKMWQELLLSKAPKEGVLKILDAGTGPSLFATALALKGHDVVGIDISPNMIKEAENNSSKFGVHPEFLLMDSQNPAFPEETFDMIVCRNVVWSMPHPEEAYKSWKKILKTGGRIVVVDGDHLRDIRDPEFKKLRQKYHQEYLTKFKEEPKVSYADFGVARGWRVDLPLAKHERPKWDIDTLTAFGYKNIEVQDITEKAYYTEKKRLMNKGTPLFLLTADK